MEQLPYYALIAAGLYITIRTRGVQWRSIKEMVRVLGDPVAREADGKKSISSFRCVYGLCRIPRGTGTVAVWPWLSLWAVPALCSDVGYHGRGAASAFAESLLVSCTRSAVRIPTSVVPRTT